MDISKKITQKNYDAMVQAHIPKSNTSLDCIKAFLVGGAICVIGQAISNFARDILLFDKAMASSFTAAILVFLGALFTGLGLYDVLGGFAGAGSIVPITGFANSMVAPALEFKREGLILGTGAKLFTIAGPVLVFGITASVITGIIYYILGLV